jgi:phosphatidylserine/phosphatidylglycerophosphate/cardiolipin synthase-like enzyme
MCERSASHLRFFANGLHRDRAENTKSNKECRARKSGFNSFYWFFQLHFTAATSRSPIFCVIQIRLWEYTRPGWTYHAKGMWIYSASSVDPSAQAEPALPIGCLVGSPNFGERSFDRDLESQVRYFYSFAS